MSDKVKLLVVDDDKSIQTVLKFVLKNEYDVTVLGDGQEAIDLLYKEKFDVVLMDIKMPKVSGLEALRKIHKIAPETDVIMLTATLSSDVTSEAMKSGAVNYLTKPFETDELKSVLQKLTKKKKVVAKSGKIQIQINSNVKFGGLIGNSPEISFIKDQLAKVTSDIYPITLNATRGSEVDMVAYQLFKISKSDSFIVVNCARDQFVVDEELFGDADEFKPSGALIVDSPKVVYLKNMQALSSSIQKKLIKWFEERYNDRNGYGSIMLVCGFSVEAEGNQVESIIDQELSYYINNKIVDVPFIGSRGSDLNELVEFSFDKYNKEYSTNVTLSSEQKNNLLNQMEFKSYKYIENVIKRIVLLTHDKNIDVENIPINIFDVMSNELLFKA